MLLVGLRILNNDLSFAVDSQDQWVAGLPEAVEELRRVSFEVAEGSYVVGDVQQGFSPNLHQI
jgi:hypothetical protein